MTGPGSRCFFVTSVECMGRTKANPNTKLASGQTGSDGEVAARLVSENLEGRRRYGDVCKIIVLRFRSQEPSKNQEQLSLTQ